ncbi:type 4 pilus major pilin [Azonexus hydrophilus]|uniref:Type 4 pilus major pilin n=1 Tax=Azonexus hydrophilus TaxID=418702 RepID=A0ABZ2XL78_9RHOO
MHFKQNLKQLKRQCGITLMEIISGLLIMGLVVAGAVSLFGSASSSQNSNQMLQDLTAARSAVQGLFRGQGGYGASTNLVPTLNTAKKLPTSWNYNGTTLANPMGGTVTIASTAAGTSVDYTITNIPTDVCVALLTQSAVGWNSVQVGTAAAITSFPISPATASNATNCAAASTNTIVFNAS